ACGDANSWVLAEEAADRKTTVTAVGATTKHATAADTGFGTITGEAYSPAANSPPKRRAVKNPTPCAFTVSPLVQTITSVASTGTVDVNTDARCGWTASSSATWLTIT